jgi:hypothetical protein
LSLVICHWSFVIGHWSLVSIWGIFMFRNIVLFFRADLYHVRLYERNKIFCRDVTCNVSTLRVLWVSSRT